ncbi:hypothetical protein ILUMI_02267 [Ignelater luminosus]|uniref:YqaJ viral recombinase domain-containing protein n=1 Tax=Ignelater luminosus TaxID=2038154 RepID=A0A8K0DIF8_IGNLU|nr:hypothetical protein ILUMI_02267 [Ignelater luminosus]
MVNIDLADILKYVGVAIRPFKEGNEVNTGLHTYKNKQPDWEAKIKKFKNPAFHSYENTMYGLQQEKHAIQAYENETAENLHACGLVINPNIPWTGCSPDGLIIKNSSIEKIVEIKCPIKGKTKSAYSLLLDGDLDYLKLVDNKVTFY